MTVRASRFPPRSRVTHHASRVLPFILVLLAAGAAQAGQRGWWPDDERPEPAATRDRPKSVPDLFMWLYQHHISRVDAIRQCRFEPSCGLYCRNAIRKHGWALGWIMGLERSIRYHSDTATYPRLVDDGHLHLSDPVADNDFWFRRPFRRRQPRR